MKECNVKSLMFTLLLQSHWADCADPGNANFMEMLFQGSPSLSVSPLLHFISALLNHSNNRCLSFRRLRL